MPKLSTSPLVSHSIARWISERSVSPRIQLSKQACIVPPSPSAQSDLNQPKCRKPMNYLIVTHTHTHTCTNSQTRTHTYTQVLIHAPTNIHRRRCCWCRQERSVSPTLQLFALPAPRPHLQPNYQWALTWCNIRSKQPISFPINLQPKCQAQQYSGLPVIQNCIMYIMFIKNQATSQARTPAPSL